MQVCRHCGWENPEIAAFCTNCGTALGRGRSTGPRFRALGVGPGDELDASSVDAEWPSATGGSLARTVVDMPVRPLGVAPAPTEHPQLARRADALVGPPSAGHAPLGRRTTAPALLPDEVEISVDAGPGFAAAVDDDEDLPEATAPRLPIEDAYGAEPAPAPAAEALAAEVLADASTVEAPAPAAAAEPEPVEPEPVEPEPKPSDDVDPHELLPEDTPTAEMEIPGGPVAEVDIQVTDPAPAPEPEPEQDTSADSLERDGFDAFVDPAERESSIEEPGFDADPSERSEDIEIESADGFAIDDDDEFDEIRIEPPSEGAVEIEPIEDSFDELELSTSDLHAVEFDEAKGEQGPAEVSSTSPALRAIPPPLPVDTTRFVLRPFSRLLDARKVVGIGAKPVVIGRGDTDVRLLEDVYVSPRHARFSVVDNRLQVEDLASLNGVWRRVRVEILLQAEDELLVGQQVLRIDSVDKRSTDLLDDEGTQRIGASPDRSGYRVTQLATDGEPLDVFHLPHAGCRIGRRLGDLVFTDDTHMSGTHALLVPRDGRVLLRDLASRNGTWVRVNGRCSLEVGDAVMLGRTVWRVGEPVRPDR